MNTQNYIESIKQIFPAIKEPQIVKDLDIAQQKFASETGLLQARAQLSSIATSVAWALPDDFDRLTDVVLYDSDGNPKYLGDYNYAYEMEFGKFYIYSKTSTPIAGLDLAIDTAYIHYKQLPTALTSRNTALEIDKQFRDALEHDVLGKYFSMYPTSMIVGGQQVMSRDLSSAGFHKKEYERLRIKAKRQLNKRRPTGSAQIYQHAGAQELPRRMNDSTVGVTVTSQLTALSQIYTKYVRFTLDSADGDGVKTPSTAQIGYSSVTGTVTGDSFALASTAEFEKDTQIICNNSAVWWSYDSSSLITFTLPIGWQVVELEIYER